MMRSVWDHGTPTGTDLGGPVQGGGMKKNLEHVIATNISGIMQSQTQSQYLNQSFLPVIPPSTATAHVDVGGSIMRARSLI